MITETEEVLTYENDFQEFVQRIDQGLPCLVDEEMFYYWLEVLPPIYMNKTQTVIIDGVSYEKNCAFGFAEGRENVIDFWNAGNRTYWAKKSNRINQD